MKAGAFARAVAGRYGAARGRFNRPSLVLLGSRRASPRHRIAGAHHVHHHRPVRVTLNFRHLELGHRRSTVVHSTAHAASLPPRIVARSVTRTVARTRVEHHVPVPGAVSPTAPSLAVVTRGRSPAEPKQRAQPETRRETRAAERFTLQPPAPPVALPPLELERVTDHVLRSLDRRMSSWRDRRGRS